MTAPPHRAGNGTLAPAHEHPEDTLLAVRFVAEAGGLMLESSPSVSEVVDRLRRFAPVVGLDECVIDATLSTLTLSYWPAGQTVPLTTMREVRIAQPRLARLTETLSLLDRVERGQLDLRAASVHLDALKTAAATQARFARLAILVSVAGWVVFLHGSGLLTLLVALLATALTFPLDTIVTRLRLPGVSGTFLAAVVLAAVPNLLAAAGLSFAVGVAMVGGLFVYLPGRALVSGLIDWLANAPVSSMARGIEAVLTAGALALGVIVGGEVGAGLGVDVHVSPEATPTLVSVVAAGVGVLGIAVAWGMPRSRVAPTVAIAALGWLIIERSAPSGSSAGWASYLFAAVVVGLAGVVVAAVQGGSASVYTGVAILPLVPGYSFYQGMLAITQGAEDAFNGAIRGALTLSLAIAGGVAIGLAVGRNLLAAREQVRVRRAPR